MAARERPRTRIVDEPGLSAAFKGLAVQAAATLPPTPAASPVEPSTFHAALLQAEKTANEEWNTQLQHPPPLPEKKIDEADAESAPRTVPRELPGTSAYTLLVDMQQFLEDEAADKRSFARLGELVGSLYATNDIIHKLGRTAHTENNWALVGVTMKKASDHVSALATELGNLLAFNRARASNIERLVRYSKAVSAGAVPAVDAMIRDRDGEDVVLDAPAQEYYMFHFANEALAAFEPTERLHLSAFDTAA